MYHLCKGVTHNKDTRSKNKALELLTKHMMLIKLNRKQIIFFSLTVQNRRRETLAELGGPPNWLHVAYETTML